MGDVAAFLDAQREAMAKSGEEFRVRMDAVATILHGEAHICGKRVALTWPDGLPGGMTEEDVLRLLDRAAGREP